MKIYHVETQEDYDALMLELEVKGYKVFKMDISSYYNGDCCVNTEDDRNICHANKEYYENNFDDIPIEKYKAKQNNVVNSPNHYTQNGRETIENIRDTMSSEGYQGYCVGNVVKYLARYKFKNGLEDVRKAKKYIEFLEEELIKEED